MVVSEIVTIFIIMPIFLLLLLMIILIMMIKIKFCSFFRLLVNTCFCSVFHICVNSHLCDELHLYFPCFQCYIFLAPDKAYFSSLVTGWRLDMMSKDFLKWNFQFNSVFVDNVSIYSHAYSQITSDNGNIKIIVIVKKQVEVDE